jgi:glycine dehydrogenase subunit 1
LAEACILACRETGRKKLVVAHTLHPQYRQTLRTYLKQADVRMEGIPHANGVSDLNRLKPLLDHEVAALVVQMPNALGCLEPVEACAPLAQAVGALFIVVVNPISLGILKGPGLYGADIVVGEGQPLGVDLQYGGPYLGLFACREKLLRKIPGRIVGMTQDVQGHRGFVLTLQTREQHIRRSKATSNICTNEAMMALAATVYLSALGKEGFREVAYQNLLKAHAACDRLIALPGVEPLFSSPFFNEFALQVPVDPEALNQHLLSQGFLGGFPLQRWYPEFENGWLICVTEVRTRGEIARFVEAVKAAISDG